MSVEYPAPDVTFSNRMEEFYSRLNELENKLPEHLNKEKIFKAFDKLYQTTDIFQFLFDTGVSIISVFEKVNNTEDSDMGNVIEGFKFKMREVLTNRLNNIVSSGEIKRVDIAQPIHDIVPPTDLNPIKDSDYLEKHKFEISNKELCIVVSPYAHEDIAKLFIKDSVWKTYDAHHVFEEDWLTALHRAVLSTGKESYSNDFTSKGLGNITFQIYANDIVYGITDKGTSFESWLVGTDYCLVEDGLIKVDQKKIDTKVAEEIEFYVSLRERVDDKNFDTFKAGVVLYPIHRKLNLFKTLETLGMSIDNLMYHLSLVQDYDLHSFRDNLLHSLETDLEEKQKAH